MTTPVIPSGRLVCALTRTHLLVMCGAKGVPQSFKRATRAHATPGSTQYRSHIDSWGATFEVFKDTAMAQVGRLIKEVGLIVAHAINDHTRSVCAVVVTHTPGTDTVEARARDAIHGTYVVRILLEQRSPY